MAQEAMVTEDNLREAQLAAHIAVNPDVIPEPSVYFQDFNFGGTMFDALFGNAEALSGVGAGISDVALEERMALEAEDRKKDDPMDASLIAELGVQQREELLAMTTATYANGQFTMFGMTVEEEDLSTAIDDALEDFDAYCDRHKIPEAERASHYTFLMALKAAPPEEQARMMTERAQSSPEGASEMKGLMEDAQEIGLNRTRTAEVTVGEVAQARELAMDAPEQVVEAAISGTRVQQDAVAVQIDSNEVWINARAAQGYADREIDDLADRRTVESGDELASIFGDVASERQFADARDTTPATPRNESNSVPSLG
ncbi:hypothetical protein LPB140_10335 [Sphingorhabdus lutea]|uniref:Uncharacterized protein n=2 Tax=Sphingorhabdus lutea TaxID=1913578 RepID=A0A1L3JDA6_9SPHN|nr:hypothetical protein LPB140_10335 [Sphingorhabdus lutea]